MKLSPYVAFVLLLATSLKMTEVSAQSGSRICGWLAQQNAIALSYEARQDSVTYSQECDQAEKSLWDAIQKNTNLKKLKWTKTHKWTCEDVGKYVVPKGQKTDICENMSASCAYVIQTKQTGVDWGGNPVYQTTYKKSGCK
jgi:hypothetical protein